MGVTSALQAMRQRLSRGNGARHPRSRHRRRRRHPCPPLGGKQARPASGRVVLKVILASAAGTNPVPQGLDFLRRLAGACVLRDAEASGDGIRKIVARRQFRLRENAKAQ